MQLRNRNYRENIGAGAGPAIPTFTSCRTWKGRERTEKTEFLRNTGGGWTACRYKDRLTSFNKSRGDGGGSLHGIRKWAVHWDATRRKRLKRPNDSRKKKVSLPPCQKKKGKDDWGRSWAECMGKGLSYETVVGSVDAKKRNK